MQRQNRPFWDIPFLAVELTQNQIAYLRKKLGWSQSAMARALGIASPMTISHWETGFRTPTATAMRLLCLLYTLPEAELRHVAHRLEEISQGKIKVRN